VQHGDQVVNQGGEFVGRGPFFPAHQLSLIHSTGLSSPICSDALRISSLTQYRPSSHHCRSLRLHARAAAAQVGRGARGWAAAWCKLQFLHRAIKLVWFKQGHVLLRDV
jgi:hypothetical protein